MQHVTMLTVTSSESRREPPTVVLTCGLPGAGKTTYAQGLEKGGYIRLSIDEEVWRRFGGYGVDYDPERYAELSAVAEGTLGDRLVKLVGQGQNVVVDFSFWQRAQRDHYKQLITDAGGTWRLVYLKADPALLRQRLAKRTGRFDANAAFPITDDTLASYLANFEEPDGEGEEVIIAST